MSAQQSQMSFAFYGHTRAPMPARSAVSAQERDRQLSIATKLVDA